MAVFVFYRIPLDFLQKEWMQRPFISGSDRKKNCRFCVVWNVCVRNGIRCLMEWKNGFIGAEKNTTGIFVKNFTKCTEASAATKKNGRTWVNSF